MTGTNIIEIQGLNLDRAVRLLYKHGIKIKNLQRKDKKTVTMQVNCSSKKLFAIFSHSCYNLKILKSYEISAILQSMKARLGLILGTVLCVVVILVYTGSVREIQISGIEKIEETEVVAVLTDMGITVGTPKTKINLNALADRLTTRLKLAAFTTVSLKGITLKITIIERTVTDIIDETPCDILSKFDGTVTGIIVTSGTAKVKIGDKVKIGQMLIEGKINNPDGSFTPVKAEGKIYGTVNKVYEEVYECNVKTPYRTGNSQKFTYLTLFSLTFPQNTAFSCDYAEFQEERTQKYLFQNMLLPFERITVTYYEIDYMTEHIDFDKVSKYIIEEAEIRARESVVSGEIKNLTTLVTDTENGKKITVTMVVEAEFTE